MLGLSTRLSNAVSALKLFDQRSATIQFHDFANIITILNFLLYEYITVPLFLNIVMLVTLLQLMRSCHCHHRHNGNYLLL